MNGAQRCLQWLRYPSTPCWESLNWIVILNLLTREMWMRADESHWTGNRIFRLAACLLIAVILSTSEDSWANCTWKQNPAEWQGVLSPCGLSARWSHVMYIYLAALSRLGRQGGVRGHVVPAYQHHRAIYGYTSYTNRTTQQHDRLMTYYRANLHCSEPWCTSSR